LNGNQVFTGEQQFQVKEIEIFSITLWVNFHPHVIFPGRCETFISLSSIRKSHVIPDWDDSITEQWISDLDFPTITIGLPGHEFQLNLPDNDYRMKSQIQAKDNQKFSITKTVTVLQIHPISRKSHPFRDMKVGQWSPRSKKFTRRWIWNPSCCLSFYLCDIAHKKANNCFESVLGCMNKISDQTQ
jgi:hypothetical protein